MQSEESNTLVKLAKAVIEHAPEGGDAFWDIKFSDIEAALSAAEPVGSQWRHKGWTGGQWQNCPDGANDRKFADAEYRPVYALPTAPVDLRSLEDHVLADFTHLTENQSLSGLYLVKRIKERFASFALSAQVQNVADSPAIKAIAAERARQIEVEGWTPEHDDAHAKGELLLAAKAYFAHATDRALSLPDGERAGIPFVWPWDKKWWKPKTPRKDLIRAGALALAEIERIKRLYHVRAEHRCIDAEAHYRLIVAELERLDSAAAPAKQEG